MTLQSIPLMQSRKKVEVQVICVGREGDCELPLSLCLRFFVKPEIVSTWSAVSPRWALLKRPQIFFNVHQG